MINIQNAPPPGDYLSSVLKTIASDPSKERELLLRLPAAKVTTIIAPRASRDPESSEEIRSIFLGILHEPVKGDPESTLDFYPFYSSAPLARRCLKDLGVSLEKAELWTTTAREFFALIQPFPRIARLNAGSAHSFDISVERGRALAELCPTMRYPPSSPVEISPKGPGETD
ncbi:MAG: hypothetical protein LBO66_01055 [Deltaproteobacteria bacterium]|jgi:hypothetical protein|nr:hypothetical protein [Deltaproteobacteria bacterium]